jgi:hypothetical protein
VSARVPLSVACRIAGVKPGTIRRWVHDRRINRYDDGYDLTELLHWIDQRCTAALHVRAGITGSGDDLRTRRVET